MSVTPASAIPAALTALVALLRADAGLSAGTIHDGPPTTQLDSGWELIVGGNSEPSDPLSASSQLTDSSLRRGDTAETFDVPCSIEYWAATELVEPCRTAAFAVLDTVKAALVRDPRLGGAVKRARIAGALDFSAGHLETQTGIETGVGIAFAVRCDVP